MAKRKYKRRPKKKVVKPIVVKPVLPVAPIAPGSVSIVDEAVQV